MPAADDSLDWAYRSLASAVILHAVVDYVTRNRHHYSFASASRFLRERHGRMIIELMGMDPELVWQNARLRRRQFRAFVRAGDVRGLHQWQLRYFPGWTRMSHMIGENDGENAKQEA